MSRKVFVKDYKGYEDLPLMPITFVPSTDNQTGFWKTYKPILNKEKCIKCFICWKFCPEPSIDIDEEDYPVVRLKHCKGCGICANECPKDAIKMVLEE